MIDPSRQSSLRLLHRCPSCSAAIPQDNIHVLSESDRRILTHAHCPHCKTNYLTHITNSANGIVGSAVLTDANYSEAKKFLKTTALHEDDFLEIYKLLNSNQFIGSIKVSINK